MGAPTDCPSCDRPALRDGACSACGFTAPDTNVNDLPDDDARAVGLREIARIRRDLEERS